METLYHETNRLIQETQNLFQQLNHTNMDTSNVENNISTKIAMVNAYVSRDPYPSPVVAEITHSFDIFKQKL